MAMAAFAARAGDISAPKTGNPNAWTFEHLLNDNFPEMRFIVVRSSDIGCEPGCPEWISAEGIIEAGTPAKLKRILKTLGRRQLPIVVNSPGGNVDAALQLGRIIRKNKLDIAVGMTSFSECWQGAMGCPADDGKGVAHLGTASDGGAMCNSACPLMFAGGIRRLAGGGAYLGVHQITTTYRREKLLYRTTYRIVNGKKKIISTRVVSRKNAGSYKTYEMSKAVEKRLSAYLKEMGVEQGVLGVMKATPASDIRQIEPEDMLEMKLVTSLDSLDLLTERTICQRQPAPANCREIPASGKPVAIAPVEAKPASPQPVEAAPPPPSRDEEMRFALVRGSNPLCNPDCPEWISAEGVIAAATPDKLLQLLDGIGQRRLPVVISSPGGDVQGALAAGRLIREHKLDVAVAHTDFLDCDPGAVGCLVRDGLHDGLTVESGGTCDSACAIMVAGGVRRLVGSAAHLNLHSLGMGDKVKAYLDEMAIGPGLFPAMQSVLYASHRELSQSEMQTFGLTTGLQSVDALTGATICRSAPRPDNCRVVPAADAEAKAPAKL